MKKPKNKITRRTASKLFALGASSLMLDPLFAVSGNPRMSTRSIPTSKEKLPVVGLGTWQTFDVGNSPQQREPLKEVLKILVDHGGSVVDSSPMYGRSEQVVGELAAELNLNEQIFAATKVWTKGKDAGIREMRRSMELMNAKPMDLMQIHNLLDWKTHLKTLRTWKAEKLVRYIGITHYHSGGYAEIERILNTEKIDFLQINYNLAVRSAAERILPLAKDKGVAVLINRPFEGGSLFRKTKNQTLPAWASEFNANSWGQFFLKFILAHDAVTCVIPGTSKAKHMKDNVQAGYGPLPSPAHQRKMIDLIQS